MALPDLLPIKPFTQPVRGSVSLPGSKSITNRALLLAALGNRRAIKLTGALFSEDTRLMAAALRNLGVFVLENETENTLTIDGQGGLIPAQSADLFVGLAGTAARFLTAFCAAAQAGVYRLDGVPQMRKRPMKGLIDVLRTLGADIRCLGEEGFFPLEIHARGLNGGEVKIDASESSQMLSALLMVAPFARGPVTVTFVGTVRASYVEMTAQMMKAFNAGRDLVSRTSPQTFAIKAEPYASPTGIYNIEPDASAASYFIALPTVTSGKLTLLGAQDAGQGLQGDTRFAEVIRLVGARAQATAQGLEVSSDLKSGIAYNFKEISDTFLTLAAISPLLSGPTKITGIAHTRKQETDRVAGMARELIKLGQHVIETEDSLEVHPRPLKSGVTIETYHDHRFAMSFGILGCHDLHKNGQPWLTIKDPACCAKTFPNFFELLEQLRQNSVNG